MILIDTSSWIHFLRPDGDATVRARVTAALDAGTARWCPLIRLELWNGAGGARERKVLRTFERLVPELPVTDAVWTTAYDMARLCRTAGTTVPATDLLIAACAREHGATIEHSDGDFDAIARATTRDGDNEDR